MISFFAPRRRSLRAVLAQLLLCAFTASISVQILSAQDKPDNVYDQTRKFGDILSIIKRNYVDTVSSSKLTESAIRGLLSTLDPHSVYLPAETQKIENERFQGNYAGIGVQFRIINDTITVLAPTIGGPSERLGIRCNDKIVKINNESAIGLKSADVPLKLKGQPGTRVTVAIKREGASDLLPVTITREAVAIHSVDAAYMIEGTDVGYIYVNKFAATTTDEVRQAGIILKQKGMKKLVLDLRWNGGGLLNQAYALADEFVPGGKTIVYTKARNEDLSERYTSTRGGTLENMPLVVLINYGSASASEIVSGAVQDLDRGLVVGETSFGKGLVQLPYTLPDGSAVRLTIAHYYTPSGRCIQRSYKDKSKYYALEGREELDEGANLEHRNERDSTRPKFKTEAGRVVFGGGGIVPDYVVKSDTASRFRQELGKAGVLGEFGEKYILAKGNAVRESYSNDLTLFLNKFQVDDTMMADFKAIAKEKNVTWNEEAFKGEEDSIKRQIKGFLTSYIWTTSPEFVAAYTQRKEIDKGVSLFPEAMKIARATVKQ